MPLAQGFSVKDVMSETSVRSKRESRETHVLAAGAIAAIETPLFILASPRSFTSVVCAMIGQHPQMYGLPETNLFGFRTVAGWLRVCAKLQDQMSHGLLRAVAEVYWGEQTHGTIRLAHAWLRRRSHFTTAFLFETLAGQVGRRSLVDKSPSIVFRPQFMRRAYAMFPYARFLHLVRHPRSYGESFSKAIEMQTRHGALPRWLWCKAADPAPTTEGKTLQTKTRVDPQYFWLKHNRSIGDFLTTVPEGQKLQIRGEDLMSEPDRVLTRISHWLGVRTDARAIDEMKHPERSPYASLGPPGAKFGNNRLFLEDPVFRPYCANVQTLDGPLPWRTDGQGFDTKVCQLARELGYS